MSLTDYLRIARRFWKGIVALVLVSTVAAFGWYLIQPRIYAAEASGMVISSGADNLSWSLAGDSLAKSKAKSYKTVADSASVADRVIADLGLPTTATALAGSVTVTVPTDGTEIRISAQDRDPAQAQNVANAWVKALAAQVNDLEKDANSKGNPAVKVVPLATAMLPTSPVSPKLSLALGVGVVGGLLLGLAYAFIRDRVDRRIRTSEEAERFGYPVIGSLPLDDVLVKGSSVLEGAGGHQFMHEALRELRTNLRFIDVDHQPRIVLVTSSLPSEGKSTVIANLASTLAADAEPVIVVDADLRRPNVHNVFGVSGEVGVTDILSGRAGIDDVIQTWPGNDLVRVLAAGHIPPNPSELLGSQAMRNLLSTLAQDSLVLVDAPPVLPFTDAAVLSRVADGTLVLVRAARTKVDELSHALGNLQRVKGRVLGLILNGVPSKGADARARGYYGHYGYAEPPARGRAQKPAAQRHEASHRRRGTAAVAPAEWRDVEAATGHDTGETQWDRAHEDTGRSGGFGSHYPAPSHLGLASEHLEHPEHPEQDAARDYSEWAQTDYGIAEREDSQSQAAAPEDSAEDDGMWLPARVRESYGSRRRGV
jgi:capsular exopolysaccharide synthesis family protein